MHIYQIAVPLVAFGFIIFAIAQFAKGKSTVLEMITWVLIWGFIIAVAIEPDLITVYLANALGIKSNVNAFIFLSIGILFFIQYNFYISIKKQNRILTDLVRKIALRDAAKDEESKS
jgi:hypothetical protein